MAPTLYVQKPFKVTAEQYLAGATPLPPPQTRDGLCVCHNPPFTNGTPHVHSATRIWPVTDTDWIVRQAWTPHDWFVLSHAEFQDRF